MQQNINANFQAVSKLLAALCKNLEVRGSIPGSKAKTGKPGLHVYGKKAVGILGRKPQQTYLFGVIRQKNFVGFYSMPLYSHPRAFKFSPELAKQVKGKSCINISGLSASILKELSAHIKQGIEIYKKEGWV